MESKKLHQMQQANTHLVPQPMPQIKAPLFHQVTGDYAPHSPVFQNVPQYNSITSNFAQIERTGHHQPRHHSSQHHLAPSSNNHLHIKPLQNSHSSMLSGYTAHRQTQPPSQSLYGTDSVYQNNRDRHYQQSALRSQPTSQHNHSHAMNKFQSEYQQLQQAKIQQQIQTQNEALIQQQRTFAIRQQLNPPIPQSHMHNLQSSQNLRSIPPSTLNLTTQFQPASGPSDSNNDEKIYGAAQRNYNQTSPNSVQSQSIYHQKQKSHQQIARQKMQESSPSELTPIIQQNHPDLVVNQACQTQIPEIVANKSKSQNDSPVHQSLERKKSSGTIQSLKSPVTKRPASAPVTLSGWLYKQGSEGLKVWRKRWFVLSEYCLYYYKGPEEEKLLGSILLPSYRVAACLPEDKIYRKFAFKCEHQNMRTYWLSAETPEIMGHWIRALTAATVMQSSSESSDHVSQPSFSSLNPSGENSDSGILTYQSQQSKVSALQSHGPVTPAMDTGGPLYANAPPKPRRANDGGYSSPSPENSIDRYESSFDKNKYFDTTAQPQSYHSQHMLNLPMSQTHMNEPIYGSQHLNKSNNMQNSKFKNNWDTSNANQLKSPYGGPDMQHQDLQHLLSFQSELYQGNRDNIIRAPQRFEDYSRKHYNDPNDVDAYGMQPLLSSQQKYELQIEINNSERRTPDTYGRSRIDQINRNLMDYEDIYNLNSQADMNAYRRPTSPPSHKNVQHMQSSSQRAIPSKLEQKQNVRMRRPVQSIPRPHSADFLEYETRMETANNPIPEILRAPRPKSSLDINRTPDNFYYSEASYAEKMRQSALYLQKTPNILYSKDAMKQSSSRGDVSSHSMGYNTIPGEGDGGFAMHSDSKQNSSHMPRQHRSHNKNISLQNEQFLRSASVRLPRKADYNGMRDNEQKREESMKRLLEWKQRMLQSPLTRKGVPISLALDAKTPLSVKTASITQGIQRSRSATNANNAGYNSYSSDDEDEPHIPPAGRASPRPTPPSSSSEETVPSQTYDYPKPNPKALCTTLLDKDSYVPVYAQKTVKDSISTGSEPNSEQNSNVDGDVNSSNSTDSTLNVNKSEQSFTDETSVYEMEQPEVCLENIVTSDSIDDGISDDDGKSFEYTDGDLDEALYESKSDDGDEAKTPTNDTSEEISESHYMPMTPKKSILSMSESNIFASSKLSMNDVDNDNAYVEMTTMGFSTSILANDSRSSYELVCINKKSNHCRTESEPVYMELSHLKNSTLSLNSEEPIINSKPSIKKLGNKKCFDKKNDNGNSDNLPDILKLTKNVTLSESSVSDTEDENPSDLYNVDLRSRTRFSLSDTFRPASYYLGVSRPDSSDSEIVSPPPIPSSPPPMEELNTEEIFSSENCDTIRRKSKNSLNLSYDQIPRLHSSNSSLNSIKKDGIKASRLSLPEQYLKYKIKKTDDSSSNYNTDNSSPTSSDYDLYNKLKLQSPSFSGSLYPSNVSSPLRFDGMDSSSTDEQRMKRRPISEDSMSEIESDRFDQDIPDIDLNAYLNNLQSANVYSDRQIENQWTQDSTFNDVPFIKPPEVFRNENDKIFYDNINFLKNDECALTNEQRRKAVDIENKFDLGSINDNPKTASTPKSFNKNQHLNLSHPRTASIDSTTSHSSKRSYGSRSDNNALYSGFDISMLSPVHSRVSSNVSELSAQSAPYYYKDVSPVEISLTNNANSNGSNLSLSYSLTSQPPKLNNMREVGLKRNGISHIHNQLDGTTIASAAISEDILNVANKNQLIDSKNLYGKDVKIEKNVSKELTTGYVGNKLYGRSEGVKANKVPVENKVLNNVTPPKTNNTTIQCNSDRNGANTYSNLSNESRMNRSNQVVAEANLNESSDGNSLWEEDEIWRERLRRVSHRHARSLDDLDKIDKDSPTNGGNQSAATEKIQMRGNNSGSMRNEPPAVATITTTTTTTTAASYDENDVYVQLAKDSNSDLYERLRDDNVRKSVEINRETLRQWDSMSSGLMKSATGSNIGVGLQSKTKTSNVDSEDSGSTSASISVQNVRNIHNSHINLRPEYSYDVQIPTKNKHATDYSADIYSDKFGRNRKTHSHHEPEPPERNFQNIAAIRNMDMSAGDLLSRTHEELVLLLIQLRRQNCATARSIEQCCTDIHEVQNRIRTCDERDRAENLARLDSLKQHLVDFEKQYEKSKPLVNLVDNMVKLGSLYRNGSSQNIPYSHESVTLDRLEFNQRMQEKRILQEDQKYWDRLSPNHNELQSKVQELYQLDQLLQEESGTLQNLQRDKEDLERSLGSLRNKIHHGGGTPYAMEVARKQQHDLERELSRVHQLLAENSKKLEQTVAGNAKLEKDLLVLRQKLQATKESRGSQSALGSQEATDSIPFVGGATAMLESELRRVQQLVGNMQRQRHDLSQAVRQLTENSNTLYQQIKPSDHSSQSKKKNLSTSWTETDLDSMISSDHQLSSSIDNLSINTQDLSASTYLNNRSGNFSSLNCSTSDNGDYMFNKLMSSHKQQDFDTVESSEVENDDFLEGNLHNQDKQEIKTVRIVKRESERRHRDRERTNANSSITSMQNLDHVVEEDILNTEFNRSKSLPRTFMDKHDLYASQLTDRKMKSPKSVQHLPTTAAYTPPNSMNSINYNDYYNSLTAQYPMSMSEVKDKPEGINVDHYLNHSMMAGSTYTSSNPKNPFLSNLTTSQKTDSIQSLNKAMGDLSPVFQSEAARQIITEMSGNSSEENSKKNPLASKQRRAIPREKRRHYTAPSNTLSTKSTKYVQSENDMNKNNINWRARDDLDMEVALRPRVNAPDVVRSALGQCEKISENSIDKLFAAPSKIVIPERYIPEQPPELSPEEKKRRQEKVEAIKKMLSENTTNDSTTMPPSQISAEKKQREHLLQLNQILAEQVMQMSKIVAERAMASASKNTDNNILSEDDLTSPVTPLPIYQQRDNFFC